MQDKPVIVEEKVAVATSVKSTKKVYDFWPINFRSVSKPEKVAVSFVTESGEKLAIKADLVFLNIQGDTFPNFFCLEFDTVANSSRDEEVVQALRANFSRLGNVSDIVVETEAFAVTCYRPICLGSDKKYANFCFKRGQDR